MDNLDDQLLAGLATALQTLLESGDQEASLRRALAQIGAGAGIDRACIYENIRDERGRSIAARQIHEWANDGFAPYGESFDIALVPYAPDFLDWRDRLKMGDLIIASIRDRPPSERPLFESLGIVAIAAVPIFASHVLWGFLAFKSCRGTRDWLPAEIQLLKAAAAGIGSATERHHAAIELKAANETLATQAAELKRSQRVALSLIEDAQRERERAAAASEAKSTFLAVMSHEMRTPLNGILGFVDLLLADDLIPEHRDNLDTVASSARTLLSLINDLLDLARIESGAIEIESTTGPLRESLAPDVATLTKLAEKKGIVLHFDIDPSVPDLLHFDFARYRQILMNVIGNAVKFTAEGSIRAGIRAINTTSDHTILDCIVRDTGTGISRESIGQIFNPFSQAHQSIQRHFGGTGLGLAICRDLCKLMGGQIEVQSQLGIGSTFQFTVRAELGQSLDIPAPGNRITSFPKLSTTHPGRILIVDDVAINRKLIDSFLKKLGYEAAVATDGSEAVALSAETPFDVILMDVFMPNVDGYEATRRIRTHENGDSHTYIVGISADAMSENRARCTAAGMNAFLTKPIHLPDLLEVLRSSLGNDRSDRFS